MKKAVLFLIIVTALFIVSCTKNPGFDNQKCIGKIKEVCILSENEDVKLFALNQNSKYASFEYIDETAPASLVYDFLGKSFNLSYRNSAKFAASDLRVRLYGIDDNDNSGFLFDEKTGELVRAYAIPCDEYDLAEENLKDVICELLGNIPDPEEFKYQIKTHYYRKLEGFGIESKVVDGYHTIEDNERLGAYSIFYSTGDNVLSTEKHISADFRAESITVEIIRNGAGETKEYSHVINDCAALAESYLKENVQPGFEIKSATLLENQLRNVAGEKMICSSCHVTFTDENSNAEYESIISLGFVFE